MNNWTLASEANVQKWRVRLNKKVKLPEAGQWPDKLAVPALALGAVLTTAGFLMAFLYAAPVNGAALSSPELVGDVMVTHQQLLSQKIFYFHMPVAIVSFVSLAFAAYYAIRFLMTREQRFDTCSRAAMEISLLFVVFTMVTGDLWTRFEWGVWWTWEPRLTTYLILMLIIIAYFVLRNAVDEPGNRAVGIAAHERRGSAAIHRSPERRQDDNRRTVDGRKIAIHRKIRSLSQMGFPQDDFRYGVHGQG